MIRQLWRRWAYASLVGAWALVASAGVGATSAQVEPTPTPTSDTTGGVTYNEDMGGGGSKNVVMLQNRADSRVLVRTNVQLNHISGPNVEPVNLAQAFSSCTDCQSLAVALQIDLISRTAWKVTPENAAVALNVHCTNCVTVARALQYVYSVDDPAQVPPEVSELIREMDRELKLIHTSPDITLPEAEARIDAVIARFSQLAESLNDQRDEAAETTSPDATISAHEPSSAPRF